MLLSAALFGYFGFFTIWNHTSGLTGEFLLFVALLEWTLKVSAVVFVASALVTFVHPLAANFVFGIVGLVGAVLFVLIAAMDYADARHTAMSPLLLLIFAAWNGYGSYTGLRSVFARRAEGHSFGPPPE